jgi:diacylglycerol kinase (ATP)
MKILFIINPIAGGSSNEIALNYIYELATEKGFEYTLVYTSGTWDDELIKNSIAKYQPDRIVAGGGDGTLQLVARNMIGSPVPLGIMALGSANGLATALGLPEDYAEAVKAAVNNETTIPLDLIKINNTHICVHLCDIGINAMMVKGYAENHERGMMGYIRHLGQAIHDTPLLRYKIITPNQTYEKEGFMLTIANGNRYGTGIKISEGSVSDGKFEICNVPKINLEEFVKAGLTKFDLFIEENMFSDVISCKEAEIIIDRKVDLQIDGEHVGTVDYMKVEIIEAAIKLLVS